MKKTSANEWFYLITDGFDFYFSHFNYLSSIILTRIKIYKSMFCQYCKTKTELMYLVFYFFVF